MNPPTADCGYGHPRGLTPDHWSAIWSGLVWSFGKIWLFGKKLNKDEELYLTGFLMLSAFQTIGITFANTNGIDWG